MTTTATKPARQTRQAKTGQPVAEQKPAAKQDAAKPEPAKTATWDLGTYQLPQHKPVVTAPDGEQRACQHHFGHSDVKAARTCAGHLAAELGLTIA